MTSTEPPNDRPSPVGATDRLIDEVERYLDAVVVFRALDCEPTWRYEEDSTGRAVELIAPYVDHARLV